MSDNPDSGESFETDGPHVIPVIRPAVTLPNPDSSAPQIPTHALSIVPSNAVPADTEDEPAPEKDPQEFSQDFVQRRTERQELVEQEVIPVPRSGSKKSAGKKKANGKKPPVGKWFSRTAKTSLETGTRRAVTQPLPEVPVEPPTQAMRLVDRLVDSPYQIGAVDYKKVAETGEVRSILMFALKLGETLFRFGAGALEVETSIIVVTQSLGVHEAEVNVDNQTISLNYDPVGEVPYTYQRVVRSWAENYAGLADLHRLVTDVSQEKISRDDAVAALARIRHQRPPFPLWVTFIANGIFASAFTLFLGGGVIAALWALLLVTITASVTAGLNKMRVPGAFTTMAGAGVVTAMAFGLYAAEVYSNPAMLLVGGLIPLLPSLTIVSAIQDGLQGFPMTAAGRMISAGLSYCGLVGGILLAVVLALQLGVPELDVTQQPTEFLSPLFNVGAVAVASASAAVLEQTKPRFLVPTAVVAVLGYGAYYLAEFAGFGLLLAPAFGAVAVGFVARILALRMGAPQLVLAVPGMMFLLPGLMIFRSLYHIATETDTLFVSSSGLLTATIIVVVIAMATVLGNTLARPFTRGLQSNERRRLMRR